MKLKYARRIGVGLMLGGILLLCLGYSAPNNALLLLGVAAVLGGGLFQMQFYRCPHCKLFLGKLNWKTEHTCPYCGKSLEGK